jgi:hypothetical protein
MSNCEVTSGVTNSIFGGKALECGEGSDSKRRLYWEAWGLS